MKHISLHILSYSLAATLVGELRFSQIHDSSSLFSNNFEMLWQSRNIYNFWVWLQDILLWAQKWLFHLIFLHFLPHFITFVPRLPFPSLPLLPTLSIFPSSPPPPFLLLTLQAPQHCMIAVRNSGLFIYGSLNGPSWPWIRWMHLAIKLAGRDLIRAKVARMCNTSYLKI